MDSAHIYPPVSMEEGMECLGAAVAEGQIDLIAKWISKDSVSIEYKILMGKQGNFCMIFVNFYLS